MACATCRHLKRTCSWLLGGRANYPDGECDWEPSRYSPMTETKAGSGAPDCAAALPGYITAIPAESDARRAAELAYRLRM